MVDFVHAHTIITVISRPAWCTATLSGSYTCASVFTLRTANSFMWKQ